MPMIWNAEADAKLMAAIIQICGAKLTAPQTAEVAKLMGPDCTAKAIAHRMTHFRKIGSTTMSDLTVNEGAKTPETPAKATKATKATKAERPKRAGSKRDYAAMADDKDDAEVVAEGEEETGTAEKKIKAEDDGEDFI